jgi:hypothetical protein
MAAARPPRLHPSIIACHASATTPKINGTTALEKAESKGHAECAALLTLYLQGRRTHQTHALQWLLLGHADLFLL